MQNIIEVEVTVAETNLNDAVIISNFLQIRWFKLLITRGTGTKASLTQPPEIIVVLQGQAVF